MGEQSLFHSRQEHDGELESLRGVDRHQRDAALGVGEGVGVGHERRLLEEFHELAAFGVRLLGDGDELAQILEARLGVVTGAGA